MLLSAVSVLVVAQPIFEIPEGLMNNPVYVTTFQSVLRCSIIFWGGDGNSRIALTLHKKVLRTVKVINNCVSCRQIFNKFKI